MNELVTWLRGVLDEDEQEIRVSSDQGPWGFMLADIAAKRRILDEIAPALDPNTDIAPSGSFYVLASRTLRLLASAYADWPGYREDWRP